MRRAEMIRGHGHGAVGDDETPAIDPDVGVITGNNQNVVFDLPIRGVVGSHTVASFMPAIVSALCTCAGDAQELAEDHNDLRNLV